MIAFLSGSSMSRHWVISEIVRPQPVQIFASGSSLQMRRHGELIALGAPDAGMCRLCTAERGETNVARRRAAVAH